MNKALIKVIFILQINFFFFLKKNLLILKYYVIFVYNKMKSKSVLTLARSASISAIVSGISLQYSHRTGRRRRRPQDTVTTIIAIRNSCISGLR